MIDRERGAGTGHSLAGAIVALVAWGFLAPAQAADAMRGGELARQWCATCHLVEARPSERTAVDRAPPFPGIAANRSADYLRGFLANPHFPMPNLDLGRREIEDLVAYIRTLAPRQ